MGTWPLLCRLPDEPTVYQLFPIVQKHMPASAQGVTTSSTGSFLLSFWAPVIRSDHPELCAFGRRETITVFFQYGELI